MTSHDLDPSSVKISNFVCFKNYFMTSSFDCQVLGDRSFFEIFIKNIGEAGVSPALGEARPPRS